MSDCSNSRMEPYSPQDVCKLRVYFYGQTDPWTYPLALNGRVIKDVMVGDVHYVPDSWKEDFFETAGDLIGYEHENEELRKLVLDMSRAIPMVCWANVTSCENCSDYKICGALRERMDELGVQR